MEYPSSYTTQMEVWVHSHWETGEPCEWDLLGLQCSEWLHPALLEAILDNDWRAQHMEYFTLLPVDDSSLVTVHVDSEVNENGWLEWGIIGVAVPA